MDKKNDLADRVKAWQADIGLTNYEVSVICGCSERTYERFRNGTCDNAILYTLLSLLCGAETMETLHARAGRNAVINLEDRDEF